MSSFTEDGASHASGAELIAQFNGLLSNLIEPFTVNGAKKERSRPIASEY
ncbi:hypothetical protein P3T23_006778 [Paraburkholderia sp. GAS448]